jgi:hypothetical protein
MESEFFRKVVRSWLAPEIFFYSSILPSSDGLDGQLPVIYFPHVIIDLGEESSKPGVDKSGQARKPCGRWATTLTDSPTPTFTI